MNLAFRFFERIPELKTLTQDATIRIEDLYQFPVPIQAIMRIEQLLRTEGLSITIALLNLASQRVLSAESALRLSTLVDDGLIDDLDSLREELLKIKGLCCINRNGRSLPQG